MSNELIALSILLLRYEEKYGFNDERTNTIRKAFLLVWDIEHNESEVQ